MDKKTKGAWLLAQSKSLDRVTGPGAAQLENISHAGRIGRLYNLLRRNVVDDPTPTVDKKTIEQICQLNSIDKATREVGLSALKAAGRIDVAKNGAVSVLGATTTAVLELTADFFAEQQPTKAEEAVLEISEKVADRPILRSEAAEFIGDMFKLPATGASSLIDLCKSTAIIDEEAEGSRTILFNSNTFRDGKYASKASRVLDALSAADRARLAEVQDRMRKNGALYDEDVKRTLGVELYPA